MEMNAAIVGEILASNPRATVRRAELPGLPAFALKVWHHSAPRTAHDHRAQDRRAKTIAALRQPHLARLVDHGYLDSDLPYVATELCAGQPLTGPIRAAPLRAVLDVLADVCDAVAAVHAAGLVHGRLRPNKILASVADPARGPYRTGPLSTTKLLGLLDHPPVIGTWVGAAPSLRGADAHYLAPEQIRGEPAPGPPADTFALGCMIHEAVCGDVPWGSPDFSMDYLVKRLTSPLAPPVDVAAQHGRSCPPSLAALIARALARQPKQRHANVRELAAELRDARGDLQPGH